MLGAQHRPLDVDTSAAPASRGVPTLVGVIWALLIVNTLGTGGANTIVAIPTRLAQLITMGALATAFVLVLVLNQRMRFRASAFLFLLSSLLVVSIAASLRMESGFGALARCARLAAFVATLWLLTPWWHSAITLIRDHIRILGVVLLSVLVGLLLAPELAMPDSYQGRLVGVLWYLTPPQVAQYAAITAGLAVLMWLNRTMTGLNLAWLVVPAVGLLLLSHTRTALAGLGAGVVVAGATMTLTSSRARKGLAVAAIGGGAASVVFGTTVLAWLRRGQGENALQSLTGRQEVWNQLLAVDRSLLDQLIGVGLTNKSFNGHPIDSTWLAVYHEQGILGVCLVVLAFACLVVAAARRPPSTERACAVFLIVYCLVASYTEVGIGDASPYMLHLALASLLLSNRDSAATRPLAAHQGGIR